MVEATNTNSQADEDEVMEETPDVVLEPYPQNLLLIIKAAQN